MGYEKKIIQNLKPDWYRRLSTKEKLKVQEEIKESEKKEWNNKPVLLTYGTTIRCNNPSSSLTKGRVYKVRDHFCCLVTTVYYSKWNQFVTIKNDFGFTVKVNLENFEKVRLINPPIYQKVS